MYMYATLKQKGHHGGGGQGRDEGRTGAKCSGVHRYENVTMKLRIAHCCVKLYDWASGNCILNLRHF